MKVGDSKAMTRYYNLKYRLESLEDDIRELLTVVGRITDTNARSVGLDILNSGPGVKFEARAEVFGMAIRYTTTILEMEGRLLERHREAVGDGPLIYHEGINCGVTVTVTPCDGHSDGTD
jgi:hypothetical protein